MFCCTINAADPGKHSPDCETQAPKGSCPNHRIKSHDQAGLMRWCDFCGQDAEGVQIKRGAGGWGTPR
jgi:hypothetical protein